MGMVDWPHGHLPYQLAYYLKACTPAEDRWYTRIPRARTYPLGVVMPGGLGTVGSDSHITADQPRLQIDAWAVRSHAAAELAAVVFRLLDFRFSTGVRDFVLVTPDDAEEGKFYRTKIERIERNAGGELYFDDYARVWRVTGFYAVKVNLWEGS